MARLSQLLEATHIPRQVAPSPILKASNIGESVSQCQLFSLLLQSISATFKDPVTPGPLNLPTFQAR